MQFSQKDPKWSTLAFPFTLGEYGCLITALSCLTGKTPDNVLKLLLSNKCFDDKGNLLNAKAALVLGFKRYQKLLPETKVMAPVIAETNHFAGDGFPKHFFVLLPDGNCVDPLDGLLKKNPYEIVSIRIFA